MTKEPIYETLDKLTELVESQNRAIILSKEIISLKNQMIEVCERETTIYKKENKALKICLFGIIVCSVLQFMISCYANKG
jgi:hypothetical protein